jgi:hypothetical protein
VSNENNSLKGQLKMFRMKHTHLLALDGRNVQVSATNIFNGKVQVIHADGRRSMVDAKNLTEVIEGKFTDEIRKLQKQ